MAVPMHHGYAHADIEPPSPQIEADFLPTGRLVDLLRMPRARTSVRWTRTNCHAMIP